MIKKLIHVLIIFITLPIISNASSNTQARIGNNFYDNLKDAIEAASSKDMISLMSNVNLEEGLNINKEIHINLNGNDILAPTNVFLVTGGALYLTGKGTIKETNPNYGAIKVIGSKTNTGEKYSIVNVGEYVTLEGWSGIFISHDNSKSYGINVYFAGNINAVSDLQGGEGIGIYVNGTIKDFSGEPIINILDGATIKSNGVGLYIGGYSNFFINKANIVGEHSGIAIKAGSLNIDGATIECTGPDTTPTDGYNNGVNASGTAIQIESNNGYAGNIELNIKNGSIISQNSHVIYEYIGKGTKTLVKTINLTGGTYKSDANKDVFLLSNSFKNTHTNFISGGVFSSNPSSYLISGYTATLDDEMYTITKSTMKEVNIEKEKTTTNIIKPIIITIILITLTVIIYFNRNIIINFLKNIFK